MNVFGEHLHAWSGRRAQDQTLRWQAFARYSGIYCSHQSSPSLKWHLLTHMEIKCAHVAARLCRDVTSRMKTLIVALNRDTYFVRVECVAFWWVRRKKSTRTRSSTVTSQQPIEGKRANYKALCEDEITLTHLFRLHPLQKRGNSNTRFIR
jgi:hypothetical protein